MNENEEDQDLKAVFVTTNDNPFDYFTDFDNWFRFDLMKGYKTCERISRLCGNTSELSPFVERQAIEDACDTLLKYDFFGIWRKIREK